MGPRTFDVISGRVRADVGALGYGDDIFVMGSRSGGTAKAGADFDFGVRVSPERFDEILAQRFGTPNAGSAKARALTQATDRGRIFAGEAGLSPTRDSIARMLHIPEKKVQLTIIRSGGKFDNGPQTRLSFGF
jgi:hypothetical protein